MADTPPPLPGKENYKKISWESLKKIGQRTWPLSSFCLSELASENCPGLRNGDKQEEECPHACPTRYWCSCPLAAGAGAAAGAPHPPPITTPIQPDQPLACLVSSDGCTPVLCNAMVLHTGRQAGRECRAKMTLSHANCLPEYKATRANIYDNDFYLRKFYSS